MFEYREKELEFKLQIEATGFIPFVSGLDPPIDVT